RARRTDSLDRRSATILSDPARPLHSHDNAPDLIASSGGVGGPVNDDGTIPRGSVRGWLPETIDKWNANRPGRGKRTDLAQ
ncbi:hypothetical protein RhoBH5_29595, partial [Rhodococcus sp. BH5]|nr:hypothetical protein [Rhodococcus sp. BH5]